MSIEVNGRVLILDAGTGIRGLGEYLEDTDPAIYLLLTHLHFDHVAGFPFFAPLYEPGRRLYLLNYQTERHDWSPLNLFDGKHFPLQGHLLPADYSPITTDAMVFLNEQGFTISRMAVNHPGGAYGYRLEHDGTVVVYIPDNELDPPEPGVATFDELAAFCRGADLLCHDAQYVPDDWPGKRGWGHSQVEAACRLAAAAEVRHLLLFHHDPARTDDELDRIQEESRARLRPYGIACTAAYEGLRIEFG